MVSRANRVVSSVTFTFRPLSAARSYRSNNSWTTSSMTES